MEKINSYQMDAAQLSGSPASWQLSRSGIRAKHLISPSQESLPCEDNIGMVLPGMLHFSRPMRLLGVFGPRTFFRVMMLLGVPMSVLDTESEELMEGDGPRREEEKERVQQGSG